ncbi:outer-membrane lipoprotein carrier protein LolA [Pseudomonadales bacterium]|nr:outer-membrane lipoprotein carrier protein LolA [Pseudomonadales bacterium]
MRICYGVGRWSISLPKALVFLAVLVSTATLSSWTNASPKEIRTPKVVAMSVQRFVELLAHSDSIRADFTHTMRDKGGNLLDQSSGWMAWQRPQNFRWEIIEPLTQTLIINGELFYQYDRDLEQLIVQPVSADIAALPNVLLTGDALVIDALYRVEFVEEVAIPSSGGTVQQRFRLMPKSDGGLFSAIMIEFSGQQITAIDIEDDLQQTSRFEFRQTQLLKAVGADLFELKTAPGTEIIQQ